MRDGSVYVGASDGKFTTFQPPESYREEAKRFADVLYEEQGAPPPAPGASSNADAGHIGENGNDYSNSGAIAGDEPDGGNGVDTANAPASGSGSRRRNRAEFEGGVTEELRTQRALLNRMDGELRATTDLMKRKDEEMEKMKEEIARCWKSWIAEGKHNKKNHETRRMDVGVVLVLLTGISIGFHCLTVTVSW